MSNRCSPSMATVPTTAGLAPNRRCQNAWLRIVFGGDEGGAMPGAVPGAGSGVPSASVKSLPSATRAPSSLKRFGVVLPKRTCSASPWPPSLTTTMLPVISAATPLKTVERVRRSWKSAGAHGKRATFRLRRSFQTCTSRCGSRYGSGCSSTALTTLKIAAVEPIPSASVAIAVTANAGFLRNVRAA